MEATTGFSSFLIAVALAFVTVLATLALLWGWFTWLSTRATRRDVDGGFDQADTPSIGRGMWGEPERRGACITRGCASAANGG